MGRKKGICFSKKKDRDKVSKHLKNLVTYSTYTK